HTLARLLQIRLLPLFLHWLRHRSGTPPASTSNPEQHVTAVRRASLSGVCWHSMDFGINLATSADSWKVVKRAEELGYTRAWFYDTQMLNADMFVAMGAAAVQTSKIRLATGVLIPSNRIAPVAASALASLNALAPGRIDFGISTGFTARRAMGLGPVKLGDMEEYIRIVQRLLAGDTLEWTFEGQRRKIRFLNPELGVFNVQDPIPLHLSALGPRGRQLTARPGAGWLYATAGM